jgi:hypothetical protein
VSTGLIAFGLFAVAAVLMMSSWARIIQIVDSHHRAYPTFGGHVAVLVHMHSILRAEKDAVRRTEYIRLLAATYLGVIIAASTVVLLALRA